MIERILEIDQRLFLFLNEQHVDWLDPIMFWISGKKEWIPLYMLIIGFITWKLRWKSIPIFLGIALTVLFADQTTSGFMKPFFARLRPSHDPAIADQVHTINGYLGGLYSFASSHASNTFGVASILWLSLKSRFPFFVWMFAWAALVSYTRIYLGVHYPADVVVGAMVGVMAGGLSHIILRTASKKWFPSYSLDD